MITYHYYKVKDTKNFVRYEPCTPEGVPTGERARILYVPKADAERVGDRITVELKGLEIK